MTETVVDWDIAQDPETQAWHAGGGTGIGMSVAPGGTLVKIRAATMGQGAFACWLCGELDGVKAYVVVQNGGAHVLLTRERLYPSAGGGVVSGGDAGSNGHA